MQSLLHLRFDGLYNLANYVEAFNEWLSHIETNREKFAVEGVPDSDKDPYIGKLAIRYGRVRGTGTLTHTPYNY